MTTILILCVVGILAILAELVLPGGVLGIAGGFSLVAAVVLVFVNYGATAGAFAFGVLVLASIVALAYWMKYFHRLPLVKRLILKESVGEDVELKHRQTLVGETGVALTDIHPSGLATIGDLRVDVIAEGPQIAKDSKVKVIATRGPSIIVREADSSN